MSERRIGEREFTDGVIRPVFGDDRGLYVIGDDGERVYGVWLMPADEPVSVAARARQTPGANLA